MEDIDAIVNELRAIASSVNDIANRLAATLSGTDEVAPAPQPEKATTLEEVRAALAEKTRSGLTAQVRSLLQKYGAKRLSEVKPESYKALLAEAEALRDG